MIRIPLRLVRSHLAPGPVASTRAFTLSAPIFGEPHATTKSKSPLHPARDPQSSSVSRGLDASESDNGPGFDAAKRGKTGHAAGAGKGGHGADAQGSMKDQVGGQRGGANQMGGKEETQPKGVLGRVVEAVSSERGSDPKTAKRSLHTSARILSSPRKPVAPTPGDQNDHLAHKDGGPAARPDVGKGNAGEDPHLPSHGKGVKYASAIDTEPTKSGYAAPPEGLPSTLESDYDPLPSAPGGTPSSKAGFSSTATDPPHPVLSKQAKEGTLPKKNPQPQPEMGEKGNFEAWKDRNVS